MRLSGHEINTQLRQKLAMPTGRHLYVVLGTYSASSGTSEWRSERHAAQMIGRLARR
jgi:hypothetical protein